MNKHLLKSFGIGLLLVFSPSLFAQQTIVEAKMDSASILIGHQTAIRLEVIQDKGTQVLPFALNDTLVKGIDILNISKPDTTILSDTRIQINQNIQITSFDSGFYYIPPFKYIDGIDTIESKSLSLKVVSFDVDTTGAKFAEIKTVMKPPFVWSDFLPDSPYFYIALALILLAAVAAYLYYRHKKNKPLFVTEKQEPLLPPHVRAMNALENLKQEKLWQNNREKEYYTQLTDILRLYMSERFSFNAMEMTSSEILSHIKVLSDAKSVYDNLKQIMIMSDFVKFAKMRPLADDNEVSMMNAIFFVSQTKQEEVAAEPQTDDNPVDEESPNEDAK